MAETVLPGLKSDAAKELAPYLLVVLRTQALLLEKAGHQLAHQVDAVRLPDASDIYEDLLRQVLLEATPKPVARAVVRRRSPSRGGDIIR